MTRDEKRDVTPPAWPASRLGEAAAILAEKSGMLSEPARPLSIPDHVDGEDDERVGRWIRLAAARLSLEGEAVESTYPEVEAMIRCASPALIRLPGEGPARYLALLKGGRRRVTVIGPDSTPRRIPTKVIRDLLTRELEAPLLEQIDRILREAGVEEHRRPRARTAILRERLGRARVGGCWLLKLAPGAHFGKQLRHARAPGRVAVILALFSCEQLIVLLSWWIVGRCAFRNQFEEAHLLAWALLLITGGSFQVSRMWIKGRLSIRAGGLFKRRLLFGAMKLEPEETRRQGAGQFVGRVMESEALDAVALESGFY
ncbi:MAG: ABC transporter ATP-binding protein, partial [Desulfobacterales bacterium]|nr:ABC transporter ATP-binding protein [Desulfobacterales bacterium]